jgi:hypothetical protein
MTGILLFSEQASIRNSPMANPGDWMRNAGSYFDLTKKSIQVMKASGVRKKVQAIMQLAYELAISDRKVVLAKAEPARLLDQVSRAILADLPEGLEHSR